jgi:cysteinyl-tRNA synthetase
MHNGMLQFVGEKMSKSLGNVVTLRDAIDTWGRETLLVYFLRGHWRKPLDYSDEVLKQAAAQAESFRNVFRQASEPGGDWEAFAAALNDDFSTPEALSVMHGWRDHDLLERGLEVFGLESLAEGESAPPELEQLARQRAEARERKDFDEGDRLRREIEAAGWQVRDVDAEPGFQLVPKR